jgi:hypothetical protein
VKIRRQTTINLRQGSADTCSRVVRLEVSPKAPDPLKLDWVDGWHTARRHEPEVCAGQHTLHTLCL